MKTVLKYRKPLAIFSYIWYSYGNKNRSVSASLSRCGNGARKETSMHQREMFGEAKWICDPKTGERHIVSSEDDRMGDSFVREYYFTTHENQDYCGFDDGCFGLSCDDSSWRRAALAKPVQTEYEFTDCPPDRLDREITPRPIGEKDGAVVEDGAAHCRVTVPEGVTAVFRAGGVEQTLTAGENTVDVRL